MSMAEETRRQATTDVLRVAQEHDWPQVDPSRVGLGTVMSTWGPGEDEWRQFTRWATTTQMRAIFNLFHYGVIPYRDPVETESREPDRGRPAWAPREPVRQR